MVSGQFTIILSSVADPGSGAFLTLDPGSEMGKKSGSGSYFLKFRNHFVGLKYLNSLMRIRDSGWKKVRSGIRDKHPGFATLIVRITTTFVQNQLM